MTHRDDERGQVGRGGGGAPRPSPHHHHVQGPPPRPAQTKSAQQWCWLRAAAVRVVQRGRSGRALHASHGCCATCPATASRSPPPPRIKVASVPHQGRRHAAPNTARPGPARGTTCRGEGKHACSGRGRNCIMPLPAPAASCGCRSRRRCREGWGRGGREGQEEGHVAGGASGRGAVQ